MLSRPFYMQDLETAIRRSPITALLGPRQAGKTTLMRMFAEGKPATFDSRIAARSAQAAKSRAVLGSLIGTVILDEIQQMPELFRTLRVLADRPDNQSRFVILGSASPQLIRNASEVVAGRVEFIELDGFNLSETGSSTWESLSLGGFRGSYSPILKPIWPGVKA